MKIKKSVLIAGAAIIVAVAIVATVLIVRNPRKDLSGVVGKTLSLSNGLSYCEGITRNDIKDDISEAFMSVTTFKVINIDEEDGTATLEISSPPIKNILNDCLPSETNRDFDIVFDEYIKQVNKAIYSTQQKDLITTTVKCSTIDSNGTKLVINNDFVSAIYPDINEMLSELLLNSLKEAEN